MKIPEQVTRLGIVIAAIVISLGLGALVLGMLYAGAKLSLTDSQATREG